MLLAVDVGNSNIVFGCLDGGNTVAHCRMKTLRGASSDDYVCEIERFLQHYNLRVESIDGAVLSSVVPEVDRALKKAVKKVTGLDCMMVSPRMKTGMPIHISQPDTLAADIISGCVGALQVAKPPLAVVDMGTATTVVIIDGDSCYLGGAILPGVRLALSALVDGTSLLPDLSIEAPKKCICGETVDSMQSGAVFGSAAMLDGLIQRMEEELGQPLTTVITGGLGGCIAPYCRREVHYEPNLIFKGMAALYEMNS